MQTELHAATALAKPEQRDTARKPALKTSDNAMGEPLETPNQTDIATKQRASVVRQAIIGVKEKNKAVAVTPARNGTSALPTELQQTSANPTVKKQEQQHCRHHCHRSNHAKTETQSQRPCPNCDHSNVCSSWPSQKQMSGVHPQRFVGDDGDGIAAHQTPPKAARVP
jgi:hypothetical protein